MAMRRFWRGILMMAAVLLGPDAGHAQPYRAPDHPPYPAWVVDGVVATITNPHTAPLAERLLAMSRTGEFYGDVALDPADLLLRTPPARAHAVANTLTARIATLGGPALAPAADVALALSRQAPARHQAIIRALAALATSRDPEVQWSVALVAVSIAAPEARVLIDAMIERLPMVAPPALGQWAKTLTRLANDPRRGKAAEALLARLRKGDLMTNPDRALRSLLWALYELTYDAPEHRAAAIDLLLPHIANPDVQVRRTVVEMLDWLPSRTEPTVWPRPCPLLALLDDEAVRTEVLMALDNCVDRSIPERDDALQRLLSLLERVEGDDAELAMLVAYQMAHHAPGAQQQLFGRMLARAPAASPEFHVALLDIVGRDKQRLAATPPSAGTLLLRMLDQPESLPALDSALRSILPLDPAALDRFQDRIPTLLRHPEGSVRAACASLLQDLPWRDGPWRDDIIARMLAMIDDPHAPAMGWADQVLRRSAQLDTTLDEMLLQRLEQPLGRRIGRYASRLRPAVERNPSLRPRVAAAFIARIADPAEPDWSFAASHFVALRLPDAAPRRQAAAVLAARLQAGSDPADRFGAEALLELAQEDAALRPLAIDAVMARWAGWDDPHGTLAVAVGQLAATEPSGRPDVVAALLDRLHRSEVEAGMAGPLVGLLLQPKPVTVANMLAQPPLAVQGGDAVLSEALAVVLTGGRMTDSERARLRQRLGR